MSGWVKITCMLIDLYGDNPVPEVIVDSDIMRRITLDAMFDMLVESTAAASGQTNVEAKTAGYGCSIYFSSLLMQLYMV